jgi:hypothetical protein
MTTQNKKPNTTVPRDEAAQNTPVPAKESETAGRVKPPANTTVPRDATADTTVPRDNV